jgi:isopentenyl diphosphate isomerase/L-lactate dehydrogenase-like FMN-dependent dehydrogenase
MRPVNSVEEMRGRARQRLPRLAFDFIDGGADDEVTLRANRCAFEDVVLLPRQLAGSGDRTIATTLFGKPLASPVLVGPTGLARLAHRDGELGGARGAARAGSIFVLACMSSHRLEDVAAVGGRQWFQVYPWRQQEVLETMVSRARDAGFEALVLTVDVQVVGNRERDLRNGFKIPPRPTLRAALDVARHPRWLRSLFPPIGWSNFTEAGLSPQSATSMAAWVNDMLANPGAGAKELARLRELWDGPLIVKGILTAEDARRMVALGADAVIVSNHGGRQLDGAPASLAALPAVAAAVGDEAEVLVDGGIRRGTDVVKALALGAQACLVGRPWLYGLATDGEDGVARVLELLHAEIDRTLGLLGRASPEELGADVVGRG